MIGCAIQLDGDGAEEMQIRPEGGRGIGQDIRAIVDRGSVKTAGWYGSMPPHRGNRSPGIMHPSITAERWIGGFN